MSQIKIQHKLVRHWNRASTVRSR